MALLRRVFRWWPLVALVVVAAVATIGFTLASRLTSAPEPTPQPIDDSSWASARSSTYRGLAAAPHVARNDPSCLSRRGCPYEPVTLPSCPKGIEAMSAADLHERFATLLGSIVVARGFIVVGDFWKTGAGCECCNYAGAYLALADSRQWRYPLRPYPPPSDGHARDNWEALFEFPSVVLVPSDHLEAFACSGDDTKLCCGFPEGEAVVARGKLIGVNARFWLHKRYYPGDEPALEDPRLCALRGGG